MKKIEISAEELELMNYNDVAHVILEANKNKMNLHDLFLEVCKVLDLDESEYETYITDFFELLSTDKRFIMLDEGYWDLKIKHHKGMEIESEEDEEDIILEEDDDITDDESMYDSEKAEDDDIEEDDLADLVIIDDSDEENNL